MKTIKLSLLGIFILALAACGGNGESADSEAERNHAVIDSLNQAAHEMDAKIESVIEKELEVDQALDSLDAE